MTRYTGKAKCACGKRAKWKATSKSGNGSVFVCNEHRYRLDELPDSYDDGYMSEADYQTWGRL